MLNLISISGTTGGTESYDKMLVKQNLFTEAALWVSFSLNINSLLKISEECPLSFLKNSNVISDIVQYKKKLFCKQWEVIFKEVGSSRKNGARFVRNNRKISTQFKLLELAETEAEQLLMRNKKSEIDKHLQHVELMLEKLQEFK